MLSSIAWPGSLPKSSGMIWTRSAILVRMNMFVCLILEEKSPLGNFEVLASRRSGSYVPDSPLVSFNPFIIPVVLTCLAQDLIRKTHTFSPRTTADRRLFLAGKSSAISKLFVSQALNSFMNKSCQSGNKVEVFNASQSYTT